MGSALASARHGVKLVGMEMTSLGDTAVVIEFGDVVKETTLSRVRALTESLRENPLLGTLDVVPAYTTVTVFYDLKVSGGYESFSDGLRQRATARKTRKSKWGRVVTIPVCYGEEGGPDLARVAAQAKLSVEATVALHSKPGYAVGAIGFAPGFPYLVGLSPSLHTPRLDAPRAKVPAGSVGIGGGQTGVYPVESPGGWNLIGRTPLALFRPDESEPALLRVGDVVRFKAITEKEFHAWK